MKLNMGKHFIAILLGILMPVLLLPVNAIQAQETTRELQDAEITFAVESELLLDRIVNANSIDIKTRNGIVSLEDTVNNLQIRDRAERITEAIKGVRSVINRIEVRPVSRSDTQIRNDAIRLLDRDPAADSYEKLDAEELAAGVYGVIHVVNNIILEQSWEDKEDWILKDEVEYQLFWNPRINSESIEVMADDGTVTLIGKVRS